ncbi:MAG: tRNA (adenosine(37)-N6)-threonylcarbamoyltransferase complex dimerization subunit type 1 TsaB [Thermodesulfobacterium sp.]|nr:tRNA (adenosine(37)-N6)-threonylcarbamoyltransferase complex dimerization subunit type 1 TsaB [Thermodesulfobacterium sp.]
MENPLILAIETSGKLGGIALFKEKLLVEITIRSKESYSKILFKILERIKEFYPFSLEEIDYYVINLGPGSFTGLRIGMSVLKALDLAHKKPVIGIYSLEALAFNFPKVTLPLACLVDAYTQEVFFALYRWKNFELVPEIAPCCIPLEKVKNFIKEETLFLSETLEKWESFLREELKGFFLKPELSVNLSPGLLAKVAYYKLKKNLVEFKTGEEILPLYLKSSEAERKLLKKI